MLDKKNTDWLPGSSRARMLAIALAALLFLLPLSHAADSYATVCSIANIGGGAVDLIGIAFMLVTVLIAAAYMYGKSMHNEHLEVWAKDESANLFITVLLFAGLAVFFSGSCAIAYKYNQEKSPFQASYTYLDTLLYSNGKPVIQELIKSSIEDQKDATKYLNLGFTPFFGHGVATDANLRARSANKEFVIDLYLPLVASLAAQKQLLQVIEIVAASVLLPFAFVLRIIPMTREFGNMLIAVFFAAYIIVPMVYALSGAAFAGIVSNPPPYSIYDFRDPAYGPGTGADSIFYRIGSTLPQAIFLPNLVQVVGVTCIMSLSKALHAIQA